MSGCMMVCAQVVEPAVKDDFDRWYREEHLPQAAKAFGSRRAWRGWSSVDPLTHYACYEFDDDADLGAFRDSDALRTLVAEFDRVWGSRVKRTREFVQIAQVIGA